MTYDEIYAQAAAAITELLNENRPHFNPVRLLVNTVRRSRRRRSIFRKSRASRLRSSAASI